MKELKFVFKEMWSKDPFMYFIIVATSLLNGIIPFVWILAPAYVIENRTLGMKFFIPFFIVLFLITSLSSFFISFLTGNYRMRMNNIRYGLAINIIDYSLNLSYIDQQDKKQREIINNALRAVDNPFQGIGGMILEMPNMLGLIISSFGFIWIFSSMDFYILALTLILTIIAAYFHRKAANIESDYWVEMEECEEQLMQMNYELKNPLSKLDLIMYDIIGLFRKYFQNLMDYKNDKTKEVTKKNLQLVSVFALISLLRDIIIFSWMIKNFHDGNINIGQFYIYFTAVFSFILFVERFSLYFGSYIKDMGFAKSYFKILDKNIQNYEEFSEDDFDIELRDVYFKYPSNDNYTLKNINLKIKKGEKIALVGENGAGKSTLALILAGLYQVTSGKVLINGKDLSESNIDLTKIVSAVFQDSLLLPYSIKENILLNSNKENLDDLYKLTGLDEIVEKFEKKDDQILLRTLDDQGVDLSGGQKQRLFLARALNKKNAKMLILDEPTAQLDAIAERDLYELYNTLTDDLSSVFISHRLASTQFCDRIIYLENGEITEEGTHQELLDANGKYKELFDIQAKNYKENIYEESL